MWLVITSSITSSNTSIITCETSYDTRWALVFPSKGKAKKRRTYMQYGLLNDKTVM